MTRESSIAAAAAVKRRRDLRRDGRPAERMAASRGDLSQSVLDGGVHVPARAAAGGGHHVRHWAEGGPATLSNLALLCRRHHRAVHEEGYRIDRQPDGALQFRRPAGRILAEVPRPPTARPLWLDERLDLGRAIGVLHPLATRGAGLGP